MFEHKLLDGEKLRVLAVDQNFIKPEVLEIRDPKNAESIDSACRAQYGVIGEVLVERYLPPATIGDAWPHDNVASPWWEVVGHPPHGGIVADFNKYIGGIYRRKLDPGRNVVAYAEEGEEVVLDSGELVVKRKRDDQELRQKNIGQLRQSYYS